MLQAVSSRRRLLVEDLNIVDLEGGAIEVGRVLNGVLEVAEVAVREKRGKRKSVTSSKRVRGRGNEGKRQRRAKSRRNDDGEEVE
jgi:hypothetical protein